MTKLKSPGSKAAADSELIATIEEQSAELRLLRKEVAEWRKKYEKGELRDIAFTNSEKEVQPIYTPLDAADMPEVVKPWFCGRCGATHTTPECPVTGATSPSRRRSRL